MSDACLRGGHPPGTERGHGDQVALVLDAADGLGVQLGVSGRSAGLGVTGVIVDNRGTLTPALQSLASNFLRAVGDVRVLVTQGVFVDADFNDNLVGHGDLLKSVKRKLKVVG